jgi:acyl dehydratase
VAEGSMTADELKKLVGHTFKPVVYEVEKGAIKKLAQAIQDPNPLFQDEAYAKKTKLGSIITPPTFISSFRMTEADEWMMQLNIPQKRGVNAGVDMEFFKPIRPGDVITVSAKVTEMEVKEGKSGQMVISATERTYTNQKGEVVAKMRIRGMRF